MLPHNSALQAEPTAPRVSGEVYFFAAVGALNVGSTSMRWGDQTPTYYRGLLSWGIGDDPLRTFSVHGGVFINYFHVEKYRNPSEVTRVAKKHWAELQEIALWAFEQGTVIERRPRHLRSEQSWYHIESSVFAAIARQMGLTTLP